MTRRLSRDRDGFPPLKADPPEAAALTSHSLSRGARRGIRGPPTESTITVYPAYAPEFGLLAVRRGCIPTRWMRDRMTWIIMRLSQT
ncbi:DUF4291 family protein [Streptomyces sp. LN704]|uniref:DUF4291 family protein n=1 Tax=Streptomyces sp. LN704 TaxID=3112982 RepID=UPI00371BC9E8